MHIRIVALCVVVWLGAIASVRADKLHLKSGEVLSGKVTKEKIDGEYTYTLVTEDGESQIFSRAEVKKWVYESNLTDVEIQRMFEAWRKIVEPPLKASEPSQREFFVVWRGYYGSLRSNLWLEAPSSGSFVDRWARYTAAFLSITRDHDYKKLTKTKKGCNSLKDYALYPPEGREEVAAVLKEALASVATCVKMAKDTQAIVKRIPQAHVIHRKDIRRLNDELDRLRRKSSRAKTPQQSRSRAGAQDAVRDKLRKRISRMHSDLELTTQAADTTINDFARERHVAREQIKATWEYLMQTGTGPKDDSVLPMPKAGATAAGPTILPDDELTLEYKKLINNYVTSADDLTSIGRRLLREKTASGIERLFVGKQFQIHLEVKDIEEAGPDGFRLIADHRAAASSRIVATAVLHFTGDLRDELIGCKRSARVHVMAQVRKVGLDPGLDDALKSDQPPVVHVRGDILSIITGCKP